LRGLRAGYVRVVKILDRLKAALGREDRSPEQGIVGATPGTQVGVGQVAAAERGEFPPEEFAADDPDEAE
jgi:hypothetical protein